MNRLIRMILYITAGCVGIGCAALILSFALSGGHLGWENDDIFGRAKDRVHEIASIAKEKVDTKGIAVGEESDDTKELAAVEALDDSDSSQEDPSYALYEGDAMGLLTIDSSAVQNLSVNLQHGNLLIEESEDSRIQVSYLSESDSSDEIMAVCDAGEITIQDTRQGKKSRKDVTVYLEIPGNFKFENAEIEIKAGEVDADCGFSADQLTVNTDAGLISLESMEAQIFSVAVGAGEIDIEDSVFKMVYLDCGVGTMDIEADITEYAKIDCGMGTVDLDLAKGVDSANYMLSCGVGSIEIGDNSYTGLSREKRIENGASAEFELNCGMGTISIDNF